MDPARRYWHPVVGYNYRITNIAAAIGLAQMERINQALEARYRLAGWYAERLSGLKDKVSLLRVEEWARPVFWMQTVLLSAGGEAKRDRVMACLDSAGIETRPVFYPMHMLPPYHQDSTRFPNATRCAARGINLPTHALLTEDDVDRICKELIAALQ
jgi:perosamine synthetase